MTAESEQAEQTEQTEQTDNRNIRRRRSSKNPYISSKTPYKDGFFSAFKPMPVVTLPEWAEQYRVLDSAGSSEPGKWRNSRTPYMIEIMLVLSPQSRVRVIVFMKSAQVGATENGLNFVLYLAHLRSGPIMYLLPTYDNATSFSKQRFTPALMSCEPVVKKLSMRYGNSLLEKKFPGGYISLRGANSPSALASTPFGNIVLDEIDRYPISVGNEGNPIDLVEKRMDTFPNGKIFAMSTPTLKETSQIYKLYLDSDQRVYQLPCPHCGGYFELKFEQLRWTRGVYTDTMLYCPLCGEGIKESSKTDMLARGKWVAQNPGHPHAGFHISGLYSPLGWLSWQTIARKWDASESDIEKRQVFVNTILGLPFETSDEIISSDFLKERAEDYDTRIPNEVLQLTMAVDVHKTRLEYEIRGWGVDEESWGIKYDRIYGPTYDISKILHDDTVWDELTKIRNMEFIRKDGMAMRIACVMIDSGGTESSTDVVYRYCQLLERMRVFAIKGSSRPDAPIYSPPRRRHYEGVPLFIAGTFEAKRVIYQRLKIKTPGPGYYHFPKNITSGYDELAYASITSERLVVNFKNGYKKLQWWKPHDIPNELLDLNVYNLVAIRHLKPDWVRLSARYKQTPPDKPYPRKISAHTTKKN